MTDFKEEMLSIAKSAASIRGDYVASAEDRLERTLSLIEDLANALAERSGA